MIKPKLFIFSGLPGSGKSTLSKRLATKIGAAYLRIDTVEQGLRDICKIHEVQAEGYRLSYLLAKENLSLGLSVVADCVNPVEQSRTEWQKVAEAAAVDFVNIEVLCSDKTEHRNRIESRTSEILNHQLPTWNDVLGRDYAPWVDARIETDTAGKSIDESFAELIAKL